MTEANKKSVKHLSLMALFMGIFVLVAFYVPNYSMFKMIFAYFIGALLLVGSLWFMGVFNLIYRFFKGKK